MRLVWLATVALLGASLCGQDAPKPKVTLVYVAEQQTVAAGKKVRLELRFRVLEGYHVNSHVPKSEFLLPTRLELKPVPDVSVGEAVYPVGQSYSFSFSPEEKLDVYTGDFTVTLPVEAARGEHTLDATLRYQACDKAACYPPKVLPVPVLFTAK